MIHLSITFVLTPILITILLDCKNFKFDIHTYTFFGTEPDAYISNSFTTLPRVGFTFRSGVTTVFDTGNSGCRNFQRFQKADH